MGVPTQPAEPGAGEATPIHERPAELLQRLIRFDTTNPPGNEAECVRYIEGLLDDAGIECAIHAQHPDRPNLVARLKGRGEAPPLLLYGHVDVVTTAGQDWTHPPFDGAIEDGYVWGRGALDMKGGVAMMVAALLRAKAKGASLPGDVILAVLADEEAGGDYGAKFLVERHSRLFTGVRHAIGEFGGFTLHIAGRRFYPIEVTEKQRCWLTATVTGDSGHGALPKRGGAMAHAAEVLRTLDEKRLPVHVTPEARQMVVAMSKALPLPRRLLLRRALNRRLTDRIIPLLGRERAPVFESLFHNTVNATIIRGGEKVNVIPSQVEIRLDGRLLPGFAPEDLVSELRDLLGEDVQVEVTDHEPGPGPPDMSLFDTLAGILREADPGSVPVPYLLSGVSDARFFSTLGIQTYGFTPMNLPEDFDFRETIHAADERIPVGAMKFGTNAIYQALQRFGAAE